MEKQGILKFISKSNVNVIKTLDVEIADNDEDRHKGLMWEKNIQETEGMLFIFDREQHLSFWMKNCYIPLDIIYINKKFEIVSIKKNNIPLLEKGIPSRKTAQYAVEVIGGFCEKFNINIGDKIKFEIIKPQLTQNLLP